MSTLTYDKVQPAEGTHRGPVTSIAKSHDIVGRHLPAPAPKHCACPACVAGMPHPRRDEHGQVIGS